MRLDHEITPVLVNRILYITHKGKKRDFQNFPHRHERRSHEMIFADYGKIILTVNRNTHHITPGQCIFISGGAKHSFKGEAGAPFNFLNVMFCGEVPKTLFGKSIPLNRKCLDLIGKLKQESTHEQSYCREIMGCCLTELMFHLLRQTEFSVPKKLPESANIQRYQSEIVNRAMTVIADEYSTPLNLKQLSRAAGIGESRLRQLLKIETGENFTSILHRQRITAAKHLLSEGTFSLENIANAVGYQSSSFFFKVFKRIAGMTPKSYLLSLGEPVERE